MTLFLSSDGTMLSTVANLFADFLFMCKLSQIKINTETVYVIK